jgi:hypothetical protein
MGPLRGTVAIVGVLFVFFANACGSKGSTGDVAEPGDVADTRSSGDASFEGIVDPVDVVSVPADTMGDDVTKGEEIAADAHPYDMQEVGDTDGDMEDLYIEVLEVAVELPDLTDSSSELTDIVETDSVVPDSVDQDLPELDTVGVDSPFGDVFVEDNLEPDAFFSDADGPEVVEYDAMAPVDAFEIIEDVPSCLSDCSDDPCSDDDGCGEPCSVCEEGFVCVVEGDLAICKDDCDSICQAVECGLSGGCQCGQCNDENLCTLDLCVLGTCQHLPNEVPCDDGDKCTVEDSCSWGECTGGNLKECDDGKLCTTDGCQPDTGCEHIPDDSLCSNGLGCLTFVCDPIADCVPSIVSNGEPCDDGNMCSLNSVCFEGTCQPGDKVDCDDGADCTIDSCDWDVGCVNIVIDGLCEDDDVCDGLLFCDPQIGCASGPPLDCDDNVGCTSDSCDPVEGCLNEPIELFCDDGNLCNGEEYCSPDVGCLPGIAIACDDGSECTEDVCDPQTGLCDFLMIDEDEPCQYSGDLCVESAICGGGACEPDVYLDCSDGLDCTMDACGPEIGCVSVPEDAFCVHLESECASAICDVESGCLVLPVEDGQPCDNGDICTINDVCFEGLCAAEEGVDCDDGISCTLDECMPFAGCESMPDDAECDDGDDCNGLEFCDFVDGCLPGLPPDCDDGIDCTADFCDADTGCMNDPDDGLCDDNDPCTGVNVCDPEVGCVDGDVPDCNDGVECTQDSCETGVGCKNELSDAACADLSADCVKGVCDAQLNCIEVAQEDGTSCDDSDPCTLDDACASGACVAGPVDSCDDSLDCTTDSCESGVGCAHETVEDGNACQSDDACVISSGCKAGECDTTQVYWKKSYGEGGVYLANGVASTGDGGIIFAGYAQPEGEDSQVWVVRLNSVGDIMWQKSFGGDGEDVGADVVLLAAGGFAVLAKNGDGNFWFLKLDANGALQWDTVDGAGSPDTIIETADGGLAGMGTYNQDVRIVRLTAAGTVTWSKTYDRSGSIEEGRAIVEAADGGFAVTSATTKAGKDRGWIFRVDSAGITIWNKVFGGSNYGDQLRTLSSDGEGGWTSFGWHAKIGHWMVNIKDDGVTWWQKGSGNKGSTPQVSMLTPDGDYVIGGFRNYGTNYYSMRVSKEKAFIWNRTYDFGENSSEYGYDIAAIGTSGYVIAGKAGVQAGIVKVNQWGVLECDTDSLCNGLQPAECDDEIECTLDNCAAEEGCTNTGQDSACADDEITCTATAYCDETKGCVHEALNYQCNDQDPCTADVCDPDGVGGCVHTDLEDGEGCDDLDSCTTGDVCTGGTCAGNGDCDEPTLTMPDSPSVKCTYCKYDGTCPIAGESCYGQDGHYSINWPEYDVYDDYVVDQVSGLTWQRNVTDQVGNWYQAVQSCLDLELAGEGDWRLPNRMELMSIVTYAGGAIDQDAFPNTPASRFWSASTNAAGTHGWDIWFTGGGFRTDSVWGASYYRCVRGQAPATPNYLPDTDTVLDQTTGLTWQRHLPDEIYKWSEGMAYCESLELDGETDWRLPNIKELVTLVEEHKSPVIDQTAFPDAPGGLYKSSTRSVSGGCCWGASFSSGAYTTDNAFGHVRCVRGGTCKKRDCDTYEASCGTIPDGCGGTVDCGSCEDGVVCGEAGTPYQCE